MPKKVKEKKPLYANPLFIVFLLVFSCAFLIALAVFTSLHGIGLAGEEIASENGEVVEAYEEGDDYEEELLEEEEELPPPVPRPDIHGFLSRFEYNNHTAYVLGSMHMGQENWFPLSPMVESAMAAANVFAFEFDLGVMAAIGDMAFGGQADMLVEVLELVAVINEFSMLPEGMTLEDVLPADVFENFYAMLETYPFVSYEDVADLTPLAASMMISEFIMSEFGGLYIDFSVDTYVFDFAIGQGRTIVGLNSILSELTLMYDVPLEVQASIFDDFPNFTTNATMSIQTMDSMVTAYETGDDNALLNIAFTLPQADGNPYVLFMHDVFLQRCNIFGTEILRLLRETEEPTTFFITVGAAHVLYGHIFGMLEAEGIEITELWR